MKVLCSVAIFCAVFSVYLSYASAYDRYKREANPVALAGPEAEPGVATRAGRFCNESMAEAKSPKEFCKAVSFKIVEKINHMCVKGVKFTCKVVTGDTKKKCKQFLYSHLCPTAEGIAAPALIRSNIISSEEYEDEDEITPEIPEDLMYMEDDNSRRRRSAIPSLDEYVTETCESKMAPVYEKMNAGVFDNVEFCEIVKDTVKESCGERLHRICKEVSWKAVRITCKEYLAPWICK